MRLPTQLSGYGIALLASAIITVLSVLWEPYLLYGRLAMFVAAVALSAAVGGLGPGLLATALATVAIDLVRFEPVDPSLVDPLRVIVLVEFIAIGLLVALVTASLGAGRRRAESSLARLDTMQSRSPVGFGFADTLAQLVPQNSEQYRLANRAQAAEAYYRSLFEHLNDAVFVFDADGKCIDANRAASRLLGYSRGELLHMSFADMAGLREERSNRGFGPLRPERTDHQESMLQRKNGASVPVDIRIGTVQLPTGTVFVVVVHDLTESIAAERIRVRLAREEVARAASDHERERLRAILEQSPSGIIYLDAGTGAVLANQRMNEFLGRPAVAAEGASQYQNQIRCLDGSPIPEKNLPLERALRGEVVSDTEFVIVRADGRAIPVLSSAAPVYGADGKIEGAVVSYQDITPLKDLERLREEFMRTATHELRTPITVIKGRSQLALVRDATEVLARQTFETIIRETNRMAQIVDDVLLAARLRPTGTRLEVTCFDLKPIVEEAIATTRRIHPAIQINPSIDGPVDVDADRTLIGIAIARLLKNAARYSPPDHPIEVALWRMDDRAYFSVTDHGVGVAAERQAHIFEPFYEPVPPGAPGYISVVSLDLYLAKTIIDANGGRIGFTSTPNVGSTFFFTLPLAHP